MTCLGASAGGTSTGHDPPHRCACVQAGTSHELGDNFAKVFGTRFLDEAGALVNVQQTSWGASTRLIGGIIMTHGARPRVPRACSRALCRPWISAPTWGMHWSCLHAF